MRDEVNSVQNDFHPSSFRLHPSVYAIPHGRASTAISNEKSATISRLLPSHGRSQKRPGIGARQACALVGRGVMRVREKRMAGKLRAARELRRPTRAEHMSFHGRTRPRWARVLARVLRVFCALLIVSV